MARRRAANGDDDDELELVVNEHVNDSDAGRHDDEPRGPGCAVRITVSDLDECISLPNPSRSRLAEEKHNVPFFMSMKERMSLQNYRRTKLALQWLLLIILGITAILLVSVTLGVLSTLPNNDCVDLENAPRNGKDPYLFWPDTKQLILCRKGTEKLKATLGVYHNFTYQEKVNVYDYTNETTLTINRVDDHCLNIHWTGVVSPDLPLQDCFDIENTTYWYGGYETYNQLWPINRDVRPMTPFLPSDYMSTITTGGTIDTSLFGPMLHPVWLSSNGVGVFVDEKVHLHVSVGLDRNKSQLCIQALPFFLECLPPGSSDMASLNYTLCVFDSLANVTKYFLNSSGFISHPRSYPAAQVFEKPIWSTWAKFKTNINQSAVVDFARNIKKYGFNISQLEIDDGYSNHYGELTFDEDKFPDYKSFLHDLEGVNLTAWVHPFVNFDAFNFEEGLGNSSFLPGRSNYSNVFSLVHWWNGYGAVFNFLDDLVQEHHSKQLASFTDRYHLVSLKFDAGESTYLPKCQFIPDLLNSHPAEFTKSYIEFVGNMRTELVSRAEVRVGYFTQHQPLFVRMLDRTSTWGLDNGLKSVLTTVLAFGIAGYPFVLPDMIGGNAYNVENTSNCGGISTELYVRWLQLNTFLPAMQFSVPPWECADPNVNVTRVALDMMNVRQGVIDDILKAANETLSTGYPIIRPLWWIDDSSVALKVDDEFLIGDDILVAPVLSSGTTEREVYFPDVKSEWNPKLPQDLVGKGPIPGGSSRNVSVKLTEVAYFKRVK